MEEDKCTELKNKRESEFEVFNLDCPNCKNSIEELHKLTHTLLKVSSFITWFGVDIYRVQRKIDPAKDVTQQIGSNLLEIQSMSPRKWNGKTIKNIIVDQHHQQP